MQSAISEQNSIGFASYPEVAGIIPESMEMVVVFPALRAPPNHPLSHHSRCKDPA